MAGGIGLIACGVVSVIRGSVLGSSGTTAVLTLIADVLWAGATLLLAVGLSRAGSVVARKPLGLLAAAAVALWPVTATLVNLFAGSYELEQAGSWQFWGYVSAVLPLAVGLIAAAQVARARVVPDPWNWAPLWVLGIQCLMWILPQLIGAASPTVLMEMPGLVAALGSLAFLTSTLGLGILAVILATRSRVATVPVFQSATWHNEVGSNEAP